jgi:hypothetical protein
VAPMFIVLYHEDRANTCTILPQSAKAKPCSSAGPSRGGILVRAPALSGALEPL